MQKFTSKHLSWFEDINIYKYLVAAMVLAVPLFPKFPFLRIPHTYVSIRLEDFLVGLVFLVTVIKIITKPKVLLKNDIQRRIFVYLAVGLVSLLSGIFLTRTVVPSVGILHWVRRIEYFAPFFAAYILINEKSEDILSFFIKLIMLIYIVVFIYGLGQMYLRWPVIITQNTEYSKGIALRWISGSHINSTFAGHYDLATFLVLLTPILINLLISLKEKWAKFVLIFCISGAYWLFNSAVSRISIFSFILGTTISLLIIKKWKLVPIFLVLSMAIFSFSSDLRIRFQRIIEVINVKRQQIMILPKNPVVYAKEDMAQISDSDSDLKNQDNQNNETDLVSVSTPKPVVEDRSSSIRFVVEWPRALRAFYKNPLLGTGFSSITLATDNDYLRALGEAGLLGFISFSLIIGSIFVLVYKAVLNIERFNLIEKPFVAGYSGGFIGILINAFFIDVFEASKFAIIFWFITGMFVFTVLNKLNEQNN